MFKFLVVGWDWVVKFYWVFVLYFWWGVRVEFGMVNGGVVVKFYCDGVMFVVCIVIVLLEGINEVMW